MFGFRYEFESFALEYNFLFSSVKFARSLWWTFHNYFLIEVGICGATAASRAQKASRQVPYSFIFPFYIVLFLYIPVHNILVLQIPSQYWPIRVSNNEFCAKFQNCETTAISKQTRPIICGVCSWVLLINLLNVMFSSDFFQTILSRRIKTKPENVS